MRQLKTIFALLSEGGVHHLYYRILEVKFWKLLKDREWSQAIKIGERAATYFRGDKMLKIGIADCYQQIEQKEIAFNIIEECMELEFNLNNYVQLLEHKFKKEKGEITSKYVLIDGKQNLGFIEHELKSGKESQFFLTKISKAKKDRELIFYNYIYPRIKGITPKLINLHTVNSTNVRLITMEKIHGIQPTFNKKMLDHIIKINNTITSIKYSDICDWYPSYIPEKCILIDKNNPHYPLKALMSFVLIHKESTNRFFFNEIFERMLKFRYSQKSFELISRLKAVILTNKLYSFIKPEVHYSIQHGDLKLDNMLIDQEKGKLYFIDWGQMRIGPAWTDMAGFLGFMKVPFDFIKTNYISSPIHNKDLDSIEKIFFIYTLIITWFIVFKKEEFDRSHENYLIPAVEQVEELTNEVVNNLVKN